MKLLKTAIAIILLLSLSLTISASALPSLFWNDEGWYKDALAPMIVRDGSYYVPADFFGMFEAVTVTTPQEDNLLLANAETGDYVSILVRDGSAVLNGEAEDSFRVFRIDALYYVEAETVAEALGLGTELLRAEDGAVSLRVTDGHELLTVDEVADLYASDGGSEEMDFTGWIPEEEHPDRKRLYLFCTSPEDSSDYLVSTRLADAGLNCTVFLWDDANISEILSAMACGAYGVITENAEYTAEALKSSDARIGRYTHRRTRLTLTSNDETIDGKLTKAGFNLIHTDFTVTNTTEVDLFLETLAETMQTADSCTVFLTDCCTSYDALEGIIQLLADAPGWTSANLDQ